MPDPSTSAGPGRIWAVGRVALGFLLGPLVASLGLALLFGDPRFAPVIALVATPLALLFGLPAYLVLRRWMSPTLGRCLAVGALVVFIPVLIALVSREPPWDATSSGFVTASNKRFTLAGYVEMALLAAFFSTFGAFGGLVFWACVKPSRPG